MYAGQITELIKEYGTRGHKLDGNNQKKTNELVWLCKFKILSRNTTFYNLRIY